MKNIENTETSINPLAVETLPAKDMRLGRKIDKVFLEILYGCNYRCTYCYVGPENMHPVVPAAGKLKESMAKLKKEGDFNHLVLLGGEPFLRPDIEELCEYANNLGFSSKGIVTNGSIMTPEIAESLAEKNFWVDITIRGSEEKTFNAITGKKGSLHAAMTTAELLTQSGVSVGLEYDCIPENFGQLYRSMELFHKRGIPIKQVQLHRIMPEGDAKEHANDFLLSVDMWDQVFAQAKRAQDNFGSQFIYEDGFPLCLAKPEYWDMITPCSCGFSYITVSPNGDVRTCTVQKDKLGNIFKTPITQIIKNLDANEKPAKYPKACYECTVFEACRGGCGASGQTGSKTDIFQDMFVPVKDVFNKKPQVIVDQQLQTY